MFLSLIDVLSLGKCHNFVKNILPTLKCIEMKLSILGKICESDLYALKPDERIPFIYFKGGKGSALSNIY